MNKVTLFVSIGLRKGVEPSDLLLTVDSSEVDGVDILRLSDDSTETFYIDSENTFIIGRKEEDINPTNHDLIIQLELALEGGVNPDDVSFIVYDHEVVDGFTVAVDNARINSNHLDNNIIFAPESYIIKRVRG